MTMNKKLECKDYQTHSKMLRKICKKEAQSHLCQSHKKLSFDQCFLYLYGQVKHFLQFFGDVSSSPLRTSLLNSATLLCKTQNNSTMPMLGLSLL